MKELSVVLGGKKVGVLSQDSEGEMSFAYDSNVSEILSLSMEDRSKIYSHNICEAFFGGLLPESGMVKYLIAAKYHISASNSFSLLEAIGADCAGAIAFYPDIYMSKYAGKYPMRGNILSKKDIDRLISELPEKPLLTGIDGMRLSLAGAQDKTSICMINNKFATPIGECPTTHIIKTEIKGLRSTVENEFFCLSLAKELGIDTVNIDIGVAGNIKFLLIERFDRKIEQINKVAFLSRIHQEDFCQALGVRASKKYQLEGGPGIESCLEIVNKLSKPAVEKTRFMEYLLFNLISENNDAHGKNYSIFHHEEGNVTLTPIYDVLCTSIYEKLSIKMAMKIGNSYLFSELKNSDFEPICEKGDFSPKLLKNIVNKFGRKIVAASQKTLDKLKAYPHNLDIEIAQKISQKMIRNIEFLDQML